MKLHYFIITGTSRGIGEALAGKLIKPENYLICISRTQNPRLQVQAITQKGKIRDIDFDLSETQRLPDLIHGVLRAIDPDDVASVTLVNNAGTIQPVKLIGTSNRVDLVEKNYKINLLAPALITEAFIRYTEDWNVPRKVLNISTGAAKKGVTGWAAYSSSKAGLDMFSQCLAQEQLQAANPVKVVAYSPGAVDTEMQAELRVADKTNFPELERYKEMKEKGQLLSPDYVATEIEKLLNSADFGKETFMRIKG